VSDPTRPSSVDVARVDGGSASATTTTTTAEGPRVASRVRRDYLWLKAGLLLTDCVSVAAALVLAVAAHRGFSAQSLEVWWLTAVSPLLVGLVFSAFHLYSIQRMTAAEEFRRILLGVTMVITSIVTVSFWVDADFSRLWIGLSWAIAMAFVLGSRYAWRHIVHTARQHGRLVQRTLIVGANPEAGRIVTEMLRDDLGFIPLGYVCADAWGRPTTDVPMLGHLDDLGPLIEETEADCIFVASSAIRPEHMAQVNKEARRNGIEVRVTANVQEVLSTRVSAQPLGGLMAFSLRPVRLTGVQALAKRTFDIAASTFVLVVFSPVMTLIAVAVKLSSPGPILFRQERVGYHGRPFTVLKFRTMVADAEERLPELLDLNEATGPLFKMAHDPRVTRVGRFLRKTSLDELPQLVNVLRGDMTVVGPRPPLPREVAQYEEWQLARLEVRPGITGLWQVSGRSQLPFDDYVRLDLFYIENWSLAFDLFIIAKTIPTIVSRRGAH
jgi:exopolysaccharide biosynthesis polyprenyl glycosylphosphotransferase